MLLDKEVVELREDKDYQKAVSEGLKGVVNDLLIVGQADFKPELSGLLRIWNALSRARVLRRELSSCSRGCVENLVNRELEWPREPHSVRTLCSQATFNWMRYDENRVRALITHCESMLDDPAIRQVLKGYSTIEENDKNRRIRELREELAVLKQKTLNSLNTRQIYNKLIDVRSDEFYEAHEREIQSQFLSASEGGLLGTIGNSSEE